MNIPALCSTKERLKILNHLLYKTELVSVNKTAKELKLSKGLISKFFDILVREKVFKKSKNQFIIKDNINTKAVRILLNLTNFDTNLFRKYKFVKSAAFYGSLTKGENTEDSDIDLWVLVEKVTEIDLMKLTSTLKKENKAVKPLYLTKEKLLKLKKEDPVFYYSLYFGSIIIYGDGIGKV